MHPKSVILVTLILGAPAAIAQSAASSSASPESSAPPVTLSPFEVTASSDVGYLATSTLGGTRLNTDLRDVASQVSVMTEEFLDDIAATGFNDAARYSLNVENLDEFQSPTAGAGNFATGVINNENMTRVRGLDSAGLTHDFFLTKVPLDRYNTERAIHFRADPMPFSSASAVPPAPPTPVSNALISTTGRARFHCGPMASVRCARCSISTLRSSRESSDCALFT